MEGEYEDYCIAMAASRSYTKAAGISLLIHITLLCLSALVAGHDSYTATAHDPPPIEVQIEPSRLIDMGSGKLHFTSASLPQGPKSGEKPRMRLAAVRPAVPKSVPSQPDPPITDSLPPPLPGEATADSVALPLPGEKETSAGGARYGTGDSSAGGKGNGKVGSTRDGEDGGGQYAGASYRYGELPGYPSSARRDGREGIVTIRVLVGRDGNPASVMVRETSGHDDFDNAAAQAVKKWHFSPARRGGEPVASFHDVRVRFRLYEAR